MTRKFTVTLIGNSILSFGIVLIFVLVIGSFVSKKMSKDLRQTAQQAIDIDLGNLSIIIKSKVKEIRTIQQSLETLQTRLKLKQTSRKKLIDELVHQTRTPLTILKTHLEGIEDGVINMSPEEIKTFEEQIESISFIISNMSGMIDADQEITSVKMEQFELNHLLKQIIGGLKVQYDKKEIELQLLSQQKIYVNTDKYKLSQCVYNILTNAYKFTRPNGKVTIDYREANADISGDEDADVDAHSDADSKAKANTNANANAKASANVDTNVIIEIQDTGLGIAEEDQNHLFDAYFRGQNSIGTTGEGIGLYVVKENLDKLDAHIDVESELGVGSKFTITLSK